MLDSITEEEHKALNQLLTLEDIIIQKADKGNVIALLDKSTYIEKMESILADIFPSLHLPLLRENIVSFNI